jgi:hypothetical protein
MHVTSDSSSRDRALIGLTNPRLHDAHVENLTIPLYYTGIPPGATVTIEPVHTSTIAADIAAKRGGGVPRETTERERTVTSFTLTVGADDRAGFTDVVLPVTVQPSTYQLFVVRTVKR